MLIKTMMRLLTISLLSCQSGYAQEQVFAFFEYDLKDGMSDRFVNGYAKDLEWHASQDDDWSWVGWFVTTGERRGRFIDATPDHAWGDFDRWKVDSGENARHNDIHWASYVENASGSYRTVLGEYSRADEDWLRRKYLQVYHVEVVQGQENTFDTFLQTFASSAKKKLKDMPFVWMRTVSGGDVGEHLLFVGLENLEGLGACEQLFVFSTAETSLSAAYGTSVRNVSSELWSYSEKLSLFPNE
jgi:hypothetical protein